jgi:hypothetical protein
MHKISHEVAFTKLIAIQVALWRRLLQRAGDNPLERSLCSQPIMKVELSSQKGKD